LSVDRCGPAFYRSDDIRNELQIDAEPHTGNFHTVCTAQRRSVLSLRFCIAWSQWWMFYTLYGFMKLKSTTMNLQHATYSYRSYRKVSHTKVCGVLQSKAASLNSCYFSYIVFTEIFTFLFLHNYEKNYRIWTKCSANTCIADWRLVLQTLLADVCVQIYSLFWELCTKTKGVFRERTVVCNVCIYWSNRACLE